jgi:predicted glycoside hydrolase/deacetylase ChbG (UPF0249 family)
MWPSIEKVYENATPEQVEIETRAQIDLALKAGIDVTHLDSHMGTLQFDPRYHEVYLRLAKEYDLPMRVASQETLHAFDMGGRRAKIEASGVLFPDYLVYQGRKEGEGTREYWKRKVSELKPGVTELYIHPARQSETLKRITNRWKPRVDEYKLFTNDPEMLSVMEENDITLIGWRALRDLQRSRE